MIDVMLITFVIIGAICILLGMFISVKAFGTGTKKAKAFENIYFTFEEDSDKGIVYTAKGDYSAILRIVNPVRKYSADAEGYYQFTRVLENILHTLGEGYAIQKQDVFSRREFDMSKISNLPDDARKRFLSESYFRFFNGRPYVALESYFIITRRGRKSGFKGYDPAKYKDFLVKTTKVYDRLSSENITCDFLSAKECQEYADRFFAVDFKNDVVSMNNFMVDENNISMGDSNIKIYSLLDVDDVTLPGTIKPYADVVINNTKVPQDLLSGLDSLPDVETLVYNQMIFIPNQKREILKLEKKKHRHASIPNPGNEIATEDIKKVLDIVARDGKLLVYAHNNLIVKTKAETDQQKVTNALENLLVRYGMNISKRSFNQLELFVASFPGNCFELNEEYDRYLTLSDVPLCLIYKEYQPKGENTPLKCYYTDRQGVPMAIDITGKEGEVKYTDNANFFVLGPSGSGKSYFMNTVVRQLYEQDTDVVLVDTGDSYEGLCNYFGGTYITYSKENPISMNPFKITREEYEENFEEKREFLKNLIFLIFMGKKEPDKLEETIINTTIREYFDTYFNPFNGYSDEQRKKVRDNIISNDKVKGVYNKYQQEQEDLFSENEDELKKAAEKVSERDERLREKLSAVVNDSASTEGEKERARNHLIRLTPEIIEKNYLARVERQLEYMERQKKKLKVNELKFNSYYEFAIERIPQILAEQNISFITSEFAAILRPFYKNGEFENILNNDTDATLFEKKFIVFEIDKIKDSATLAPIITLIIMDVFTQKMRLKPGRKCLVIEEAWKAIATPTMADYIKYLFKTARKHWAMVGVVTQEIQDITSSEIVKDAIISNAGVFMLLDQSKFKDKFDDIKSTLSLSDIDCRKIFTINRLENKEDRSPFKEVFIKRGLESEVYGVEEPKECYMTYTTEKIEKTALKLYRKQLNCDHQQAIEAYVRDWELSGKKKPLDFARMVLREGKVLNLKSERVRR